MGRLPQRIDPWRMAAEQSAIDGEFLQSALPRLSAIVEDCPITQERVKWCLSASRDSAGRTLLQGEAGTEVNLCCQRCLQLMTIRLYSEFSLAVVRSEPELAQLPKGLEPLLLEDSEIALEHLIEDELLLVLPSFPKHAESDCRPAWQNIPSDSAAKPFADLSVLLAKRES